jgi:hypothetical protein
MGLRSFNNPNSEFADPYGNTGMLAIAPQLAGITASGGTTSPYTDPDGVSWTSHKFTSSGSFVVSAATGTGKVEYLVVGGGGGGSGATPWDSCGGGGGAGGLRTNVTDHPLAGDDMTVSAATYPVTVGGGGAGGSQGAKPPHDPPSGSPNALLGTLQPLIV